MLLTLTVPHSGDVRADIRACVDAWPRMRRHIARHLEMDRNAPRRMRTFPYIRVLEVTASDDGHAHLHVWAVLPYVPHALLRLWWARAIGRDVPTVDASNVGDRVAPRILRRGLVTRRGPNGRPLDRVPWPVLDVRSADGDVARELVKYLVKDAENGELVEPERYARIYEALESVRTMSCARGLHDGWAPEERCPCCGGRSMRPGPPREGPEPGNPRGPPPDERRFC